MVVPTEDVFVMKRPVLVPMIPARGLVLLHVPVPIELLS
jgi:hypothetical protein